MAAISLAADDRPREGAWLRADPVHMRIDQDAVALHGPAVLDVTREEAAVLVAELQSMFTTDGFEFAAPSPDRWYVRVPEGELPRTTSLEDALGRNVFGLLPRGSGRVNWPSAITEVQMVFSGHAVNDARQSEARLAINSVWFWGEGALPPKVDSPYALIYANDAFALGLGRLSGTRSVGLPATLKGVDAVVHLAAVLDPIESLQRGDEINTGRRGAEEGWFPTLGCDRALRAKADFPTGPAPRGCDRGLALALLPDEKAARRPWLRSPRAPSTRPAARGSWPRMRSAPARIYARAGSPAWRSSRRRSRLLAPERLGHVDDAAWLLADAIAAGERMLIVAD